MLPKYRKPTHPGKILLDHFLKPMGISQSYFARHLGAHGLLLKLMKLSRVGEGLQNKPL